jgi:NAD(P)-dependent dehydrogenase (short-subunit alcohol dehydrogenase family)
MASRLEGKVAIITGGNTGIGKRTVERFVEEGATVVLAARRVEAGEAVAAACGDQAVFRKVDVAVESEVADLIGFTVDTYGQLDCLFNNAGVPAPACRVQDFSLEELDSAMRVLFGGVVAAMKHAAPVMRSQGSGSIINNGSVAASRAGLSSSTFYSAAKAAVVHLTRCVAMELGEDGVRVNAISPGGIATGIFGKAMGLSAEDAEQTAEKVKAALQGLQPIPRAGLPDDIADAAVFLASDESTFINGHELIVDGGLVGGRMWTAQQEGLAAMRAFLGADSAGEISI